MGGGDEDTGGRRRADARVREVLDTVASLRETVSQGGEYLNAHQSVAVYKEAGVAFRSCTVCSALEQVCFRPGKEDDFWTAFDRDHQNGTDDGTLSLPLVRCVHAIVNHQTRVSQEWRARAIESLRGVEGLEELCVDQLQSAINEVAQLSTAAVQAEVFFEMTGMEDKEQPSPSQPDSSAAQPPRRQLSELFENVRPADDTIWCPFVLAKDGVKDSVPEEIRRSYELLVAPALPMRAWSTNPHAFYHGFRSMASFYLESGQVTNIFGSLPAGRTLNRAQMEVVAGAMTGAVACDF